MKIHSECVPCLLKRIIFEAKQSTSDKKLQTKIIKNACSLLGELYSPSECSAIIATKVHRCAYDLLGDDDPYAQLKKTSNSVALSLVPKVEKLIQRSSDPLKTSMLCSIIGNILDFGIEGGSSKPEHLSDNFMKFFKEGLGCDDYELVVKILKKAKSIVLFTDNSGEIVFDKLLCQQLKKSFPGLCITVVVRGAPIISDATLEDVKELGFDLVVDEILTTGCFAVGVDFNRLPKQVKKVLDSADLIVCKGMANYETFSETAYSPVVYLLRTKCAPIAGSMGLFLNQNVIKLYK